MKLTLLKNPFFYLSLFLIILLGFQVARLVGAAFTEPTEPFPGGNPPTPLDTSGSAQTKLGSISFPGLTGTTTLGNGVITFNGTSLFGVDGSQPQIVFTPRDSFGNTSLYFGSGGSLFINSASGRQAAAITSGASPSTALATGFNLDFNGQINAQGFYVNGVLLTTGGGTVTGQWTVSGSDIRYSDGNVIVDKYFFEDQDSYADGVTASATVCIDDRPGLIYEKPAGGTIANLYVSGANSAGTWGVGCGNDPGPAQVNNGKKLFLSWDWSRTSDEAVRVVLTDADFPSGFALAAIYRPNTGTDTRVLAGRIYTAGGAQNPKMVLSVNWFKNRRQSYKQSYLAGTINEEKIIKNGLRLNEEENPLPPCPGLGNINVGLIWLTGATLSACSSYTYQDVNTGATTVIGWHTL